MYVSECLDGDLLDVHYATDGSHALLTGEGGAIVRCSLGKLADTLRWMDTEPGWVPGHFVWVLPDNRAVFTGLWYWNRVTLTYAQVNKVYHTLKEAPTWL